MNNKPYFENVYIYGDLYLDKVLLEYEFFSYSILKDNKGNFFVCYCYEVEKRQSWLINEIKIDDLISFLLNKIDIKTAFLIGNNKKIIIIRDYDSGKEKSESANTNKIIKMGILPDENEFLDKKEELYEYIIKLYDNLFKEDNSYIYDMIKVFSDVQKQLYNSSLLNIKDEFKDFSNDGFIIIHKKMNNYKHSNSITYSKNNYINLYKTIVATSFVSAYTDLSFDNTFKYSIKENKNYAKAT